MSDTILDRVNDVREAVEQTQQCMIRGDEHLEEMHRLDPTGKLPGNSGYSAFDNLRRLVADCRSQAEALVEPQKEIKLLQKWLADLHSGMYVNCVYCGWRYGGKDDEIPAEALHKHITECEKHPMSKLAKLCRRARTYVRETEMDVAIHKTPTTDDATFLLEDLTNTLARVGI